LAVELLHREIQAAEASEHAAELKRLKKEAQAAKRKTPDALAKYEAGVKLIEEALDEIDTIEEPVANYNAVAPAGEKMDTAEFTYRGGVPAEPRTERSRKTVEEFWAFTESGEEVTPKLLETLRIDDGRATVEVINLNPSNTALSAPLPEATVDPRTGIADFIDYPKRRVPVRRMCRIDVCYDEYRAGWAPTPLRLEVGTLPFVLPIGDPRPARKQITVRVVEAAEPVKTDAETVAA
jgi:hypothetical protein